MIVGVPKEIKNNEYRVGLLPMCRELAEQYGQALASLPDLLEADA